MLFNRKLSIISKLLSRAYQKGQIDKVPYIERQPESQGRVRYITPEEEEEIHTILYTTLTHNSDLLL